VSPVMLTKAPLLKQGQRRNPLLPSPRIRKRSTLNLEFNFRSSRIATTAETVIAKAMKGQLFAIGSRIATVAAPATTNAAQIEFAASQKRQARTKFDEIERDKSIEIGLCTQVKCR
jgi:hypothetical protein